MPRSPEETSLNPTRVRASKRCSTKEKRCSTKEKGCCTKEKGCCVKYPDNWLQAIAMANQPEIGDVIRERWRQDPGDAFIWSFVASNATSELSFDDFLSSLRSRDTISCMVSNKTPCTVPCNVIDRHSMRYRMFICNSKRLVSINAFLNV